MTEGAKPEREWMINDAERRRLAAIEDMLRAEDPEFVRRFGTQRRRSSLRGIALAGLAMVAATAMTVVALWYRNVPAAVVGLVGIGATAGICITRWSGARNQAPEPDRPAPP
jgi:hypothetical protein